MNYKLHGIYINEYDWMNEVGISVDFRNGVPEQRLRHAVALRRTPDQRSPNNPQAVAQGLHCLADWIEWKFSECNMPPEVIE